MTIPTGGDVDASLKLQFAAPTGSGQLVFATAVDQCCGQAENDVTPATLPKDDATSAMGASNSNNPVLYLSIYNGGSTAISFGTEAPSVSISATGDLATILSGDISCQLDLYVDETWISAGYFSNQGSELPASFTIPAASLPNGKSLTFAPGQSLAAIACD